MDHLIKRFAVPVISFCLWAALQIGGYHNTLLAWMLLALAVVWGFLAGATSWSPAKRQLQRFPYRLVHVSTSAVERARLAELNVVGPDVNVAIRVERVENWHSKMIPFRLTWQGRDGGRLHDVTQRLLPIGVVGFGVLAESDAGNVQFIMPSGHTLAVDGTGPGELEVEISVLTNPELASGSFRRAYAIEISDQTKIVDFRESDAKSAPISE